MSNLLKMDKKSISMKLPPSIRNFLTSQLAIPTVITIRSCFFGSTHTKSAFVNVIKGSDLLALVVGIWFTLLMAYKCLFRADFVLPLLAKPSIMDLITLCLPPSPTVEVPTWFVLDSVCSCFSLGILVLNHHNNLIGSCPNLCIYPCCY